jgi:hypothetical protein
MQQRPKRVKFAMFTDMTTTVRGVISYGDQSVPCSMADVSVGGAKLILLRDADLPAEFVLQLAGHVQRHCTLVWRNERAVGVQFKKGGRSNPNEPAPMRTVGDFKQPKS